MNDRYIDELTNELLHMLGLGPERFDTVRGTVLQAYKTGSFDAVNGEHQQTLERVARYLGLSENDGIPNRPGRAWWALTRIQEAIDHLKVADLEHESTLKVTRG